MAAKQNQLKLKTPQNIEEFVREMRTANMLLAQFAEAQAQADAHKKKYERRLNQTLSRTTGPLRKELFTRGKAMLAYAREHCIELTEEGARAIIKMLNAGTIQWSITYGEIVIDNNDKAVGWLKENGLDLFVRKVEIPDVGKLHDRHEIVNMADGMRVDRKQKFRIMPADSMLGLEFNYVTGRWTICETAARPKQPLDASEENAVAVAV